ncbi:MAG: shikimate dehydrogenase [Pseudomonadota bacterium]
MEQINAKTKVCILIGDPVEHSFSPLIHNAGFQELGVNFVYVAFQVKSKDIGNAIKGIKALNIRGASITLPHKVTAIEYMDRLDPVARKIGSINTIVNENGELKGFSSDGMGALKALHDHKVELDGKNVLILGSGGVARAIAFTLVMNTRLNRLSVLGIIKDEIEALVNNLQTVTETEVQGTVMEENILQKSMLSSHILINCTPRGMYPKAEESPVPRDFLRKELLVFDVVYNPPKTKLLQDAQSLGCDTISGIEMFINQAVLQFELWTGVKAPEAVMKKVILDHLSGA